MDPYVKPSHAKRFVVEDSITKVTSDGEPHGMMTMIAGLSGLIAAIAILAILISLLGCKKNKRINHSEGCDLSDSVVQKPPCIAEDNDRNDAGDASQPSSISRSYSRTPSIKEGSRFPSISVIYSGNLEGNLNSAFAGSELSLTDNSYKKKKRTHWSDEVEERRGVKETTIDIGM